MRIGIMLRAMDEKQGTGIYTQNLTDRLLPMDSKNEYTLFYRNPAHLGRYRRLPNVKEKVVAAPNKMLWDQLVIPAEARKEKLDLIFHTKFTVPFFTSCKTIMTVHGASWFVRPDLYPNKLDLAYIKAVMPLYCRKATFIISNSDLTTNDFIRILKVAPEKIRTVRLGTNKNFQVITDKATLEEARRQYDLPEKFILSVIRYDARKNFKNLIAAFRLLRKRAPCKLVVTGIGCEKYREEYALDSDGTSRDVQFLGWVDPKNLPALYNLARCMFFPSVYEEFGIPVAEAMACACPPVVSSTGALPEVAGDAGLIVDPFDSEKMAAVLEQIYTDDRLHTELSARCLKRAEVFTWERCARETLEILNRVGQH
jgi:glycosyltransferase involved in cell wall biosynthesis